MATLWPYGHASRVQYGAPGVQMAPATCANQRRERLRLVQKHHATGRKQPAFTYLLSIIACASQIVTSATNIHGQYHTEPIRAHSRTGPHEMAYLAAWPWHARPSSSMFLGLLGCPMGNTTQASAANTTQGITGGPL